MKKLLMAFLLTQFCFAATAQLYRNEWIDYSKTYYKFKIAKNGLFRISQPQLASIGLDNTPAPNFNIWRNGVEVPLYTSVSSGLLSATDYIEFWGTKNDGKPDTELYPNAGYQCVTDVSLFTDTAAYFLTTSPLVNSRVQATTNDTLGHGSAEPYCWYNQDLVFDASNGSIWGGNAYYTQNEYVRSATFDKAEGFQSGRLNGVIYPLTNLKAYTAGPAMSFKAIGSGRFINNRTISLSFNDSLVSQVFSSNFEIFNFNLPSIPLSRITSDATSLKFISSDGTENGKFGLAKYSLTYPRQYDCSNTSNFKFTVPANATGAYLVINNFNTAGADPILYDVANKKRYTCIRDGALVKVQLQPTATATEYILISTAAANVSTVTSFVPRNFVDYSVAANNADFIIIANKILNSGSNNQVEAYRQYRASAPGGSYNAKIFDIDDIADQFAFGIRKHSIGIFNFLRYARAKFATQPKSALLIGRGVNYLDFYIKQSSAASEMLNQVPTWGNPASDNMFGSASVNSPIPVTPVGRIAVINNNELKTYLDKVIAYEQLQQNGIQTQQSKDYTKQVLHLIGASDAVTGSIISPLMDGYRTIIKDTLMGAEVHSYIKANNPNISQSTAEVANYINNGVSLLTYFGHSSSTSLDFNLNNPSDYSNAAGKYPLFLVNGCNAGDFYNYDEKRINNNVLSISEKFVLAPDRGAIAFIASTHFGVLNTLDYLTKEWYNAAAKTKFGKSLGEIQQNAIAQTWALYPGDFLTKLTLEETTIHGDPMLKLFPYLKPDYSLELQNLEIGKGFISAVDDSFTFKITPYNIGRASNDSIWLKVQRQFPNGKVKLLFNKKLPPIYHTQSISFKVPITGNTDVGTNYIIATIDPDNLKEELSETNNTVTKPFEVSTDEIRPVFPYNYAIVDKNDFKLYGSTANPLEPSRTYRIETDSTELFNSSFLSASDVTSVGGAIEFNPPAGLVDGKVYYWRVAPIVNGSPVNWRTASYLYNPSGTPGFNQSHLYQHLKSGYERLVIDSVNGKVSFGKRINNLFITHSKYPETGTEDGHFSISVNGSTIIASFCVGTSVGFNVFDSLSFKPWVNTGNLYGGGPVCGMDPVSGISSRMFNFEFKYNSAVERKKAMDFMDLVPNGNYVVVRLVLDAEGGTYTNSYPSVWKKDTTLYGSGKSLYHYLYKNGAKDLDSINATRDGGGAIWALVYKKNDSANFTPVFRYSQGLYDRIVASVDCLTADTLGYTTSPVFGPAKLWQQVHWRGHSVETSASPDSIRLAVIGIGNNGTETVLYNLNKTQQDFDITAVNPITYPFIKLRLFNQDSLNATPWQLDYWRLNYLPVPEGAIAPNLYVAAADSTEYDSITQSSKYKFGVAFKNISEAGFDSISLKLKLIAENGTEKIVALPKLKALPMGDTTHIYFELNADTLGTGNYNLYLDVNPDNNQPEQAHFNNFMYKTVTVYRPDTSGICPGLSKIFSSGSKAFGNTYQWQVDNGAGFVAIVNDGIYSGSTADSLQLIKPPTSWYGKKYRCAITNNGNTTYSNEYMLKFSVTWLGKQDTAWENPANWSCGILPDAYTDAYIKAVCPNYPLVNSNASCRSLRVMPNTSIMVTSGFMLDITGSTAN